MKKLFRNRIFLGALCIVFALLICFVVSPMFNSAMQVRKEIVRIEKPVLKGTQITKADIVPVTVGGYNLPENIISAPQDVIGKYALADFSKGDYILTPKISDTPNKKSTYTQTINEENTVISFTIKSFANGLSSNLCPNDIISLIASSSDKVQASYVPETLKYVKVLAISCEDGSDYDINAPRSKEETAPVAATITVLATPTQALQIAELENNANIHVSLVSRDNEEKQAELLEKQAEIIKIIDEENAAKELQEQEGGAPISNDETLLNSEVETNG